MRGGVCLHKPATLTICGWLVAALCTIVPFACGDTSGSAYAQAGSAGGAIGKQGKSASGTEAPTQPTARPAPAKKKRAPRVTDESGDEPPSKKGGGCGRLAGVWTANGWWNAIFGRGDVVLSADGSARHNSGIVGTWTCRSNNFVIDWKNWAHAEGTLSADGNTITFSDGGGMTRGQ